MQILLTEEEHKALVAAAAEERKKLAATLQDLCTKVADHMPVNAGWRDNEPKPWGCVLSVGHADWYCDSCPVVDVCPLFDKPFSK